MPQRNDLELAKFDQYSDYAVRVIETDHARVHEGVSFIAGGLFTGIANNAVVEFLIQSASIIHFLPNVSVSGDAEVYLFEDTTFSAAGTPVTKFNKNRNSTKVSDAVITHTPTITADGTQFPPNFIPGGHGGIAIGGEDGGYSREIISAIGKVYLLRIKNVSGIAATICPKIEWYEPSAVAP